VKLNGVEIPEEKLNLLVRQGLSGIIHPETSLLATIDRAVVGATELVPDDKLHEIRLKVQVSLLAMGSHIEEMIYRLEELEHEVQSE
jgi:hypothetical protein